MTNVVPFTSRQFLIGQAVLNAAQEHFPWGVKHFGVAHVLRNICGSDPAILGHFHCEVVAEYNKLCGAYVEAEIEDDFCVLDPDFADAIRMAFHS